MTDQVTPEQPVSPKSLAGKLAEACDAVGGVSKKGRNQAQGYDFVRAADVAMAIRHELFQRGVVIIPNEIECSTKQVEYKTAKGEDRRANEVVLRTAYTITDGTETLLMHGYGIAWDTGDKAVYKAKTGALKYFLRGLGLIPDELEPESDEKIDREQKGKVETNEEFDQRTQNQQNIGPEQIRAIDEALKKSGKTEDEIIAALGFIGEKRIEHIKRVNFDKFLKWALGTKKVSGKEVAGAILKPASQIESPTQKAMKRLFALANELRIPEGDVKTCAYEKFGVKSMTELTVIQLDEMVAWVKEVAENSKE